MESKNENQITAPGFFVKMEWEDLISELTNEQAGVMFKNMFNYLLDRPLIETPKLESMLFKHTIEGVLRFNKEKYIDKCLHNREVGKKGGRPQKERVQKTSETQNNPSGYFDNPEKPKDKGIVKGKDIDKTIVNLNLDETCKLSSSTEKEIQYKLLDKFKQLVEVDTNTISNMEDIQFIKNCKKLVQDVGWFGFFKLIINSSAGEIPGLLKNHMTSIEEFVILDMRTHSNYYLNKLVK